MKIPGIQPILLLAPVALICALFLAPLPAPQSAQTQSDAITVQVDRPGAAISPTLFGLFFEDINFGADGGLYPERVKNRSFEFPDPMMGWKRLARGEADISLSAPMNSYVGRIAAWKTYTAVIRPTATSGKARLNLLMDGPGKVEVDLISLYPKETWKNRPNGLRADLAQLLSDLKPGFLRFPGGCIVEGRHLETRYQWKTTVGDITDRRLIVNRWNTEFRHRPTPDYYQSFGLGFYEYFLLSEDIGAEPLPILSASIDDRTGEAVLKIVNAEASSRELRINLAGAAKVGSSGKAYILAGSDLKAENSLDEPTKVAPVERQVAVSSSEFTFTLAPNSLSVLRVPMK